jgi:hypothetical protein
MCVAVGYELVMARMHHCIDQLANNIAGSTPTMSESRNEKCRNLYGSISTSRGDRVSMIKNVEKICENSELVVGL